MNVFLINMADNPTRLASADEQLRRLGVSYERIEAVNGKVLPEAERRQTVNRFRWWCAIGRPVVPAEIGVALSHASIYRRMVQEGIPCACVLEDDVMLGDRFPEQVRYVEAWLNPSEPQVILLSNHTSEVCAGQAVRPTRSDMFAEGYVVTRAAAKALLRANSPLQVPCDHWGRWVKQRFIRLYHAFPTVCCQNQKQFGSGTSQGRGEAVRNWPLCRRIIHHAMRLIGRTLDGALSLLERIAR